jgi:hypothetical protein
LGTQSISEQFGAFSAGIEDLIPAIYVVLRDADHTI